MSDEQSSQFYADNEVAGEVSEKDVDLSLAYEIKDKSVPEEAWGHQPVQYFCHTCEHVVATKKAPGKGLKFLCAECNGKQISFGTQRSLRNFFKLNDEGRTKVG